MKMMIRGFTFIALSFCLLCTNEFNATIVEIPSNNSDTPAIESPPIEYYYPIPSTSQLEWMDAEVSMFIHFGMNTFTNVEWGDGTEKPEQFNPTGIDVLQWVSIAKETGFKYVILTAKHHDGFCLWPSKFTSHTITNSPYRNGKGDIIREFADACHSQGIKMGLYYSPWDRHEKTYGTEEYNLYFRNQLIELLTIYGDVGEIWLDGANGDTLNKMSYNWDLIFTTIRHYQPDAIIANKGLDARWVGNEMGIGNETEWSVQRETKNMKLSDMYGNVWYPSECDVSIRPGWFYHESEDRYVKSADSLVQIYFQTVGRNSNLLLNIPPDKKELISTIDYKNLKKFKSRLDSIFSENIFKEQEIYASNERSSEYTASFCLDNNRETFWTTALDTTHAELTIVLKAKKKLNIVRLEEAIRYGQRVKSFRLLYKDNLEWKQCFQGTTIGKSRIVTFDPVTTDAFKVIIDESLAAPTLRTVKGYYSSIMK